MNTITIQLAQWLGRDDARLRDAYHPVVYSRAFLWSEILIADTRPIAEADIRAAHARGLRGIVRPGVGYDNVPLALCRDLGITCAYTPHAPSESVAELTLGLMIVATRGVFPSSRALVAGRWERSLGRNLSKLTVGIVGLGRIGKRVAAMIAPLCARVLAFDPYCPDTTFDAIHHLERVDELGVLLAQSDIVTLHVPRTAKTMGMIGAAELAVMRPEGVLINTARGGIVDEAALLVHLVAHPEFVACLDVFAEEPYRGPLGGLPNCLPTPHLGAMTRESRERMEREAVDAALAICDGRPPRWRIPEE